MKKTIFTLLAVATIFAFGANYAKADTWLSDAINDGGFGNCHYEQYTGTDADGDGTYELVNVSILHGHWSNGVCVISVVEAGPDGDMTEATLVNTFWNFILNTLRAEKDIVIE